MSSQLPVLALVVLVACGGRGDPGPAIDGPFDGSAPESVAPGRDARQGRGEGGGLEVSEDAPTVIFLGDSISAGLHLPQDEAFPAVLERRLAADGLEFRLVNAGVSGDTTAGGLARIDWVLSGAPEIVVVELGANDGLRGIQLAAVEANLRAIIERVRETGARVLLLGALLPPNYGPEYAGGFAEIYPRLADELSVEFVPYFMEGVGGVPEMNLADGLHPTPVGHERLADNVAPKLRVLLRALD